MTIKNETLQYVLVVVKLKAALRAPRVGGPRRCVPLRHATRVPRASAAVDNAVTRVANVERFFKNAFVPRPNRTVSGKHRPHVEAVLKFVTG